MEESGMSTQQYFKIKSRLVPKHLSMKQYVRKRVDTRRFMLMESPSDIIQKAKLKYLKPIVEMQTIMKHFDLQFHNNGVSSKLQHPLSKRMHRQGDQSDSIELLDKMKYLLSLPTLKTIQLRAEKYRNELNVEETKRKEDIKQRILNDFDNYIRAELKANPLPAKKRLFTIS